MSFKLEIACFDAPSAIRAARVGADRIELCTDYDSGGLTPPAAWLEVLRGSLVIPVHVMIRPRARLGSRPRAGDFCYSPAEFDCMKADIHDFKALGADGFVFGILDRADAVDIERNRELVDLARPLPCTFHRAFDCQEDKAEALETIISLGFTTLLTSGILGSAIDGQETLGQLVRLAADRIQVMPGGGIRSVNITGLAASVQARWYHSAAWQAGDGKLDEAELGRMKQALAMAGVPGIEA
jgi:copper homeostasis protein